MKDFDTSRAARRRSEDQRTFKLAGETFIMKNGVRPEALAGFDAITPDSPIIDMMAAWDELFLAMIEDRDGEAERRYRALRDSTVDPLTLEDLDEVVLWMMEEVGGRPTGSSSDSSDGREQTGTSSTDASSSPVAAVA